MAKFVDLTGARFGKLTVVTVKGKRVSGSRFRWYWECVCDCGKTTVARTDSLRRGSVRSCGCLKEAQDRTNLVANHRHKLSGTRIYHEWVTMKRRCLNESDKRYVDYGGRGIMVCDEWKDKPDAFFEWAIANGYRDDLTIDRIDNNGNYEPSNCRWVTAKEQSRNRRSNVLVEYMGRQITLVELAERTGISAACLRARYSKGERGEFLIRPKETRVRLVAYNGEMVTLRQLSELTGINYSTLVSRHFYKKPLITE